MENVLIHNKTLGQAVDFNVLSIFFSLNTLVPYTDGEKLCLWTECWKWKQ